LLQGVRRLHRQPDAVSQLCMGLHRWRSGGRRSELERSRVRHRPRSPEPWGGTVAGPSVSWRHEHRPTRRRDPGGAVGTILLLAWLLLGHRRQIGLPATLFPPLALCLADRGMHPQRLSPPEQIHRTNPENAGIWATKCRLL